MADFSFLSDTDDSAVDELLSLTQDLCVLEQVSKINCSGFTDSVLPTELESRFRKLKTFPVSKSKPVVSFDDSRTRFKRSGDGKSEGDSAIFSPSKQNSKEELGFGSKSQSQQESMESSENQIRSRSLKAKSKCRYVSSPSDSSSSAEIDEILKPSLKKEGKKLSKANSESGFFSSPSRSSPSPPRKTGCFWCSPKKNSVKKNNKNMFLENDLFLSDLSVFSAKEQQKMLKKAMKKEEEINREVEKIIKMAKQASARMNISDMEDKFSDHESRK